MKAESLKAPHVNFVRGKSITSLESYLLLCDLSVLGRLRYF